MAAPPTPIRCDGCGLPATPQHLAQRLERLELSTRYRPVHIAVLFVAFAPVGQQDFYRSPATDPFSRSLLAALDIPRLPVTEAAERDGDPSATLSEFQRRGYYLCYVSECPLPPERSLLQGAAALARLAPSLVLRIQRNYKPHKIAVLGLELRPLLAVLRAAGVGPLALASGGEPLLLPEANDASALAQFRSALDSK